MSDEVKQGRWNLLRHRMHEIIFEADTPAGKFFDVALLWAILLSLITVMLESVGSINQKYGGALYAIERAFTVVFTIEYIARVISINRPLKYIFSFMGLIDLMAILPSYFDIFFSGSHYLVTIRTLRLLRVFRIFKLARYIGEANVLMSALKASRPKITVFVMAVLSIVTVMGTLMYQIEGAENGFTSIPKSIYWAIVTLTTVGYGDIAPQTVLGQFVASTLMVTGYAIIAIPTGIVTAELTAKVNKKITTQSCPECSLEGHDPDADYCKYCGALLNKES